MYNMNPKNVMSYHNHNAKRAHPLTHHLVALHLTSFAEQYRKIPQTWLMCNGGHRNYPGPLQLNSEEYLNAAIKWAACGFEGMYCIDFLSYPRE